MARPIQMGALVLRSQQLADMQNDTSIDPVEWNAIVSEAYGEGYETIAAEGTRYFETTATLPTTGSNIVTAPATMLAIVDQLELVLDAATGQCRRLYPITPQQRAALSGRVGWPRFYEPIAGQFSLYPTPPAGQLLTLRFIGQCPDLTNAPGTQLVDCYCVAGQKFIQYAAAAAAIEKSKNDASALIPKIEQQRALLQAWASDLQMNAQPVWYVEDADGDCWPTNWSM